MKNIYLKKIFVTLALLFFIHIVSAQIETMSGFVTGSSLADAGNSTYVVMGETFTGKAIGGGHELSMGLAQAQLEKMMIEATVNYGDGYSGSGFSYPTTTPPGTYEESIYEVHGGSHHYDLLKKLKLIVKAYVSCGETVYDGDHNDYPTVAVAGYCWTQKNLKAQHYADGTTEINKALVYKSGMHPNETANEATFGRLYTWYSAVNVPENSTVTPTVNADGFVQGICPDGWHIPTEMEMNALLALPAEDIRSTDYWLGPHTNTNSTLFTALPAGFFNSSTNRFENLLGTTGFWTDHYSPYTTHLLVLQHFCDTPLLKESNSSDGWSVRCVKNY